MKITFETPICSFQVPIAGNLKAQLTEIGRALAIKARAAYNTCEVT